MEVNMLENLQEEMNMVMAAKIMLMVLPSKVAFDLDVVMVLVYLFLKMK